MTGIIETERLVLRVWHDDDIEPYFAINQNAKVIEYLPGPMSIESVKDFLANQNKQQHEKGYMLWATELKQSGELIGFIGLNTVRFDAHFTPAVEIGWRLGSQFWGKGYATEGAKAALQYGFNQCQLDKIMAFTVKENLRSQKVMQRCNMKLVENGDFAHPWLDPGHRLSLHTLYQIER